MEPAVPVVGQPVRFLISISAPDFCCATGLNFGDGTPYVPVSPGSCTTTSNVTDAPVSHTYTAPGLYSVSFIAATFPCTPTFVDGHPVAGPISGAGIKACVLVGPTAVAYREPCS
jgi:PKD domain-containing protein